MYKKDTSDLPIDSMYLIEGNDGGYTSRNREDRVMEILEYKSDKLCF